MNYTRRPNRPDGDVYREMRRQGFRKPRDVGGGGRRSRGWILPVLIVVLVCAGIAGWSFWH